MNYEKQTFKNGQVLTADCLNRMEDGIKQACDAALPECPSADCSKVLSYGANGPEWVDMPQGAGGSGGGSGGSSGGGTNDVTTSVFEVTKNSRISTLNGTQWGRLESKDGFSCCKRYFPLSSNSAIEVHDQTNTKISGTVGKRYYSVPPEYDPNKDLETDDCAPYYTGNAYIAGETTYVRLQWNNVDYDFVKVKIGDSYYGETQNGDGSGNGGDNGSGNGSDNSNAVSRTEFDNLKNTVEANSSEIASVKNDISSINSLTSELPNVEKALYNNWDVIECECGSINSNGQNVDATDSKFFRTVGFVKISEFVRNDSGVPWVEAKYSDLQHPYTRLKAPTGYRYYDNNKNFIGTKVTDAAVYVRFIFGSTSYDDGFGNQFDRFDLFDREGKRFKTTKYKDVMAASDNPNVVGLRSLFPKVSYFGKLKKYCPNFYNHLLDKDKDLTIVMTGTSLTQGNMYVTERADASTRPPALHTNDLASHIFDRLATYFPLQNYRRYDHPDLTFSGDSWVVTAEHSDWDDNSKNPLTKTTAGQNASVSITVPSDAWAFNFIYKTDTKGCECSVSIADGDGLTQNGLMQVFNGTEWVEANEYKFSMKESDITTTKGNTQYQKRLKMRCKDKNNGINSITKTKLLTIVKKSTGNMNVWGFEYSPREYMFTLVNSARGGHQWGLGSSKQNSNLQYWQDTDVWAFNPDLIMAEVTLINWGGSTQTRKNYDPLFFVDIAKKVYFNEGETSDDNSLFAKSNGYQNCEVIFFGDTVGIDESGGSQMWDNNNPKHYEVEDKDDFVASESNRGKVVTIFDNYLAVDKYMFSKDDDYLYLSLHNYFETVASSYFGKYFLSFKGSGKNGSTLSNDGTHWNDNGALLASAIIAPLFDL